MSLPHTDIRLCVQCTPPKNDRKLIDGSKKKTKQTNFGYVRVSPNGKKSANLPNFYQWQPENPERFSATNGTIGKNDIIGRSHDGIL